MNRIRLISLLCFLLFCVPAAQAQVRIISREKLDSVSNPKLAPNSNALEFDRLHIAAEPMTEDDAPESFTYTFRNLSQSSLTVSRIVSTCSCVQATYDRKVVAPGEYATVKVVYDPKGHPGTFERKIFVYTDENIQPSATLRLSVKVSSGVDKSGQFPVDMGKIRLRSKEVKVSARAKSVQTLVYMNVSDAPLTLRCEDMLLPSCLQFRSEPETVGKGEEGQIVITYDPAADGKKRKEYLLVLKDMGLPPSQSSIKIKVE